MKLGKAAERWKGWKQRTQRMTSNHRPFIPSRYCASWRGERGRASRKKRGERIK